MQMRLRHTTDIRSHRLTKRLILPSACGCCNRSGISRRQRPNNGAIKHLPQPLPRPLYFDRTEVAIPEVIHYHRPLRVKSRLTESQRGEVIDSLQHSRISASTLATSPGHTRLPPASQSQTHPLSVIPLGRHNRALPMSRQPAPSSYGPVPPWHRPPSRTVQYAGYSPK